MTLLSKMPKSDIGQTCAQHVVGATADLQLPIFDVEKLEMMLIDAWTAGADYGFTKAAAVIEAKLAARAS